MEPRLVYDVGVHRGDDTAYYLHKGFRVVGVEANPIMADHLRARFAPEIASGLLQLLQVGVAENEGELDFWVCDAVTEWSSFHEKKASAGGRTSRPVKVRTLPFATILRQCGVPFYCKIDIEGNDHLCLEGIDAADKPKYVSVEMSLAKGDRDLSLLQALGYRKFKIISQVTFGPARSALQVALSYVPRQVRRAIKRMEKSGFGKPRDGDWSFAFGSSGAFGDGLPGHWLDYDRAVAVWRAINGIYVRQRSSGLGEWYDIHATG
jgi:FkbM family methyltransferase